MKAKLNLPMLVLVVSIAGAVTACSKKSDGHPNVRVAIEHVDALRGFVVQV